MNFTQNDNGYNLILVIILWSIVMFNFYLINMDAKSFAGGIYQNTLAISLSSLLGVIVTRTILEFL